MHEADLIIICVGLCCGVLAVTFPGWYISGYVFDGQGNNTQLYTNGNNETDINATSISNSSASIVSYEISRCPANTYNNGGNVATSCTPCPNGTVTRFDPSPWYGYYNMYNPYGVTTGNTEDMCGECSG
jgi:hypothetical protein